MTESGRAGTNPLRRALMGLLVVLAIGVGVGVGAFLASISAGSGPVAAIVGGAEPGATLGSAPSGVPIPAPSPTATPAPTPEPTPSVVAAPLTGLPISPEAALHHPIAVMVDDHRAARPQAGFNAAAVVWQAPAEGGIPRYLLIFQDAVPASVGPVRSARQYYIDWAAEWKAMYVHVGGEPRALASLRSGGDGSLVWNIEERFYEGTYLWRALDRPVPHNVYSDGEHLRQLAALVGASDGPIEPAWAFGPGLSRGTRPTGTELTVHYPYESITYRYDADSNTYRRYIDGAAEPQVDAADGLVVAPANVVILRMPFGPLNDGHPDKDRLKAEDVGSGEAIISTSGRILYGTWSKASISAPTLLFDASGHPVRLNAGQTFVQVIPLDYAYEVVRGTRPETGGGAR